MHATRAETHWGALTSNLKQETFVWLSGKDVNYQILWLQRMMQIRSLRSAIEIL